MGMEGTVPNHGEEKDAEHLLEIELGTRCLREGERGKSEIGFGAAGVEAVIGGKDQAGKEVRELALTHA